MKIIINREDLRGVEVSDTISYLGYKGYFLGVNPELSTLAKMVSRQGKTMISEEMLSLPYGNGNVKGISGRTIHETDQNYEWDLEVLNTGESRE